MVCKLQLVVVLITVVVCHSRKFQNPVLVDRDQPRVISFNNTYYMVSKDQEFGRSSWFPIHQSIDLENWELLAYVFDEDNYPAWTSDPSHMNDPYLHFIGGYFYITFQGNVVSGTPNVIGVAKSTSIAGPYASASKPLNIQGDPLTPAIVVDNSNADTYLVWYNYIFSNMLGQKINLTDLTLSEGEPIAILRPSLTWEHENTAPYFVYRNGFYYIFYNGLRFCGSNSAIGVARSRFPLGPYQKLEAPLVSDLLLSYGYPSVVQDVDGSSDVILYQGDCGLGMVNASPLVWSSDGWPSVELSMQ